MRFPRVIWCGWGVFCAGGANRGTDTICGPADRRRGRPRQIEGQTRYFRAPVGRSRLPGHTDMGTGTMSRHDVRCTDQERPTPNVQLSTFNGVTERAHGGRDMGTDATFEVRHTARERSTSNVQLATFNGGIERAHGGRDMGTDTIFGCGRAALRESPAKKVNPLAIPGKHCGANKLIVWE